MEYSPGCVFSLAEKNAPIPGCTVSEAICSGETDVVCYSLAAGTDISAEGRSKSVCPAVRRGRFTRWTLL